MEAKMDLAAEMVERFHGKRDADLARESFTRVFKEKALPEDMPEVDIRLDRPWICSVLKEASMVQSTSEAKRLVAQGAVSIDEQKVSDPELVLAPGAYIIKVGKRRFARVTIG
jgi:tyrosyl-tRNA synthetase